MHEKTNLFRHAFVLSGALAGSLLLTTCGKLMDYGSANSNGNSQAKQASSPAVADKTNTTGSTAAQPVSAGPAIATTDGDMPGIRVEVQELKRTSGDTLTLKFSMINDSDKEMGSFGYEFGDPDHSIKDFGAIGGVHLIDAAGKKKYFVVRDAENTCVCSQKVPKINTKSRANLFAKFPAPPADVQKISVVIPHFIPMDDVPITP